jgi:hypothetical protein
MRRKNHHAWILAMCLVLATAGSMCVTTACLAKPHAHAQQSKPQIIEREDDSSATSSDDSSSASPQEDSSTQISDENTDSSAATPAADDSSNVQTPSEILGKRFRQPGVSLFSLVGGAFSFCIMISMALGFIMAGNVLLCAFVWHLTKLFRGGQKPAVG